MSVKRYEWVACDEHSCHCDVVESAEGDMVDYEDYAALEARCAALAAEVSTTNERLQRLIQIINNADNSYCMCGEAMETHTHGGCGHPTGMFDYHYGKWLETVKQTHDTEAFLAEVRAQGVDLVCDYHKSRCEALRDVDRNGSQRHGAALCDAIDIAHQIRKGVQS